MYSGRESIFSPRSQRCDNMKWHQINEEAEEDEEKRTKYRNDMAELEIMREFLGQSMLYRAPLLSISDFAGDKRKRREA